MNYNQFKEEMLPYLREITRFQLKTVHPDRVVREKKSLEYNEEVLEVFPIILYQRITEPWEFILFTDLGIAGLVATESWKKNYFPKQIIELDEGKYSNYTEFIRHFDHRFFKESQGSGRSLLSYLPITFLKKNKPIDRHNFSKFLYHAVSHPEQYESESLDDAIEQLINDYEDFSFKH